MVEGVVEVVLHHGLKAVAENELTLQTHACLEAELPQPIELSAEHAARSDLQGRPVGLDGLAVNQREAGHVGQDAQCGQVGDHAEVLKAFVPAREVETAKGVHAHVGGQDVGAGFRHVEPVGDPVEEYPGAEPLALETPHHVGDANHDCGDVLTIHRGPEFLGGNETGEPGQLVALVSLLAAHQTTSSAREACVAVLPRAGMR